MPILTEDDFKKYKSKLDEDGYAVIKGIVDADKSKEYVSRFWDYLEGLSVQNKIDRNDPATWSGPHWPSNLHGIFKNYNVGHAQFVWDARAEEGIISFFQQLWETKDLLVSFDGACMIRPSLCTKKSNKWAHTDQAPLIKIPNANGKFVEVRDFPCVQGLLNLRPCGPTDGGLVVYKGSHKQHQQYFIDKGSIENKNCKWIDSTDNWYKFDPDSEEDNNFLSGFEKIKVCCDPGDFIVWYSRTVHYAESIDKKNSLPMAHRMCIYVCMLPKKYATKKDYEKKKTALQDLRTTSHWPCIKIKMNPKNPRTYGDDQVLDNFIIPTEPPILSDRMKELAGVDKSFKFIKKGREGEPEMKKRKVD
ncbi:hypothetical protein AKO1_001399 [Acrasis kona]|uniref:Phytanoyl-CoA dioxygenase n=1 Tax=Acrasis kona TaxID=1008807 RepID=A0AAW2ZC36_9EUKA